MRISRRIWVLTIAATPILASDLLSAPQAPADWKCPMDPEVHLPGPGKCPKCGMTLVLTLPEPVEYALDIELQPQAPVPGEEVLLALRASSPEGEPATQFELVHEKLIHLFVVSEDLEFFQHVHPVLGPDYAFRIKMRLPKPGMYRLLADYYPSKATPQLSLATFYVKGSSTPAALKPVLTPQEGLNTRTNLRCDPEQPVAGLLSRLSYDLDPYDGLELYLGAWAHTLIVSGDLVDMIHTHPFLVRRPTIQFNVIFPRSGLYRIWTQFQRNSVVNTIEFTVPVRDI